MGDISNQRIFKMIKEINPHMMISCSFKEKIPEELLSIEGNRIINIHGALLPEYRGANMLNWVLVKGCSETGITMHYMDKELDSGDIISQVKYPIEYNDDAVSLKKKMFKKVGQLLDEGIDFILHNRVPVKQDHSKGYYYLARSPTDGKVNWNSNAVDIYNLVRALVYPFPGAFSYNGEKKYIFEKVEVVVNNLVCFSPGRIIEVGSNHIVVSAQYNLIKILVIRDNNIKDLPFKVGGYFR